VVTVGHGGRASEGEPCTTCTLTCEAWEESQNSVAGWRVCKEMTEHVICLGRQESPEPTLIRATQHYCCGPCCHFIDLPKSLIQIKSYSIV
jgi:hypothetical protein